MESNQKFINNYHMVETNTTPEINMSSLGKRILIGGGIALVLISFFLYKSGEPDPSWGQMWMLRPLIIVPLAGATGGAFFYFMEYMALRGSLNKVFGFLLAIIVYIVGLWMGTVLGLDGTMWN